MKIVTSTNRLLIIISIVVFFIISLANSLSLNQEKAIAEASVRFNYGITAAVSTLAFGRKIDMMSYTSVFRKFQEEGIYKSPNREDQIKAMKDANVINNAINSTLAIKNPAELGDVKVTREDKGQVFFFIAAFKLFGIKIQSLLYFYYVLFFLTLLLFIVQFRKHNELLLLPLSFTFIHALMMIVIWEVGIELLTPVNPRFFSALGFIPAYHLFLSAIYSKFTLKTVITVVLQSLLLVLVIISRSSANYFLLFMIGSLILMIFLKRKEYGITNKWMKTPINFIVVFISFFVLFSSLFVYKKVLARNYSKVEETHYFWHPVFLGLFYHPDSKELHGERCCDDMTSFNLYQKHLDQLSLTQGETIPFDDAGFESFLKQKTFSLIKENPAYTIENYLYKFYRTVTLPFDLKYPLMKTLFSWQALLFFTIWVILIFQIQFYNTTLLWSIFYLCALSALPSMMLAPEYYAASDFVICYVILLFFIPFYLKLLYSRLKVKHAV